MDMIIMALPVFALLVVAEVLYTSSQGRNAYALKDFGGSMSQLGINSLVRLAIGGALAELGNDVSAGRRLRQEGNVTHLALPFLPGASASVL